MNDNTLEQLEDHIPQLIEFKENSTLLNNWWDATSIIARVNQDSLEGNAHTLLESMQNTKTRFIDLQQQLNNCLLKESFKKANMDLTFKSQNLIDVLTRNLFERTAEVGFLATDQELRSFVMSNSSANKNHIQKRLSEYVAKYSVYEEVILLKPSGEVLVNFDTNNRVKDSNDPLIKEVIKTNEPYLEYFRYSDLRPENIKSHIFTTAIRTTNEHNAPICGILVMFFKLHDEMDRIFNSLLQQPDPSSIALVDDKQKVLISSNETRLTTGELVPALSTSLNKHKALLHLSNTKGYQGYMGLNWLGVISQPAQYAFRAVDISKKDAEEYQLWQQSNLVSNDLKSINLEAIKLNSELRVLTLNGKSVSHRLKAHSFMPILEKLQELGDEMGKVVSKVVTEINQTALANLKANCVFYSNLAVDIMDRNLYERANDCRWWALTPTFTNLLSKEHLSNDDKSQLHNELAYINELYTVYTNVFLFDCQGNIITASHLDDIPTNAQSVANSPWFKQTTSLTNSQQYAVSEYEKSELYAGQETYIYSAAIKSTRGAIIGGIGVVFDSKPEFEAMLQDCLPVSETGEPLEHASALFIDQHATIIASTDENWLVGSTLPIPEALMKIKNGESRHAVTELNSDNYLIGVTCSSGYREYKTTGDYSNDVIAVVMIKM